MTPESRTCKVCGGILGSKNIHGYCASNETCRRAGHAAHERARRKAGAYKRESYIYAILFPQENLLKVGKSTRDHWWTINTARKSLKRQRNLVVTQAVQVWEHAGGLREEQFMHASLSFKYPPLWNATCRASEWYKVDNDTLREIVVKLEEIWGLMPLPEWKEN